MISFAVVGGGWRSEFYIRVANALPHLFSITGIYLRNEKTQAEFSNKYSIKIFDNLEKMLETKPDFVVSCVNKGHILNEIELLCQNGVAVLSETPAGISNQQINKFKENYNKEYKVQVAEQFHLMPTNKAIKAVINSGVLGEVNYVSLSCCHDYHAISLMRFFLDINENEIPTVQGFTLSDSLTRYNGRYGDIEPERINSEQKIALIKWGKRVGIYNFNKEQYFSQIRQKSITVRGTNGEIQNGICTYLENGKIKSFKLKALEGFENSGLNEDEQAIAECLIKMDNYLKTGEAFYPLSKAISDSEISLLI
ncbi:MAG: Gfo/Idh/MocA family oxidoreductase [Ruminococcaceae bacterium]|nr:Gfo/Idh/MocA family oxidoreductase [Oscillospiraceae bacterium]